MEAVALVVELWALLSRAKGAEVLSCLRHIVVEDFEDDTRLLVAFLALLTDGDIEVGLLVLRIELRQFVMLLGNLAILLVVVDTLAEEGSEASLLLLRLIRFLLLDGLELGSKVSIGGGQLDSCLDIDHGRVKVTELLLSDRAKVNSLGGVSIDLNCLRAVANRLCEVLGVVSADRHVLKNGHHEFVELGGRVFDGLCVG